MAYPINAVFRPVSPSSSNSLASEIAESRSSRDLTNRIVLPILHTDSEGTKKWVYETARRMAESAGFKPGKPAEEFLPLTPPPLEMDLQLAWSPKWVDFPLLPNVPAAEPPLLGPIRTNKRTFRRTVRTDHVNVQDVFDLKLQQILIDKFYPEGTAVRSKVGGRRNFRIAGKLNEDGTIPLSGSKGELLLLHVKQLAPLFPKKDCLVLCRGADEQNPHLLILGTTSHSGSGKYKVIPVGCKASTSLSLWSKGRNILFDVIQVSREALAGLAPQPVVLNSDNGRVSATAYDIRDLELRPLPQPVAAPLE